MHEAVKYIHANSQKLRDAYLPSDKAGVLTESARRLLQDSGGMRLLQSRDHGGYEASLADFMEWTRAVGRYCAPAGWIAGIVGVHPHEIALADSKLQEEIYGTDENTWIASPYAPQGRAVPEEGGYRFSGAWQYSTGTDHCSWIVLGGLVAGESGEPIRPAKMLHFFLPRSDYEIIDDSWHTMGLSGTGSKDIRVQDAFVPGYRTLDAKALSEGEYAERRSTTLYKMPHGCVFAAAIAAGSFGIAEGAIEQYRSYLETRRSTMGVVGKTDLFQQEALAEVEADLEAGITHLDVMFEQWIAQIERGEPISKGQRLTFRRNQVRAVQRVLFGVDKVFSRAGSAAIWSTRGIERYWRDLRTAGTHVAVMADLIYGAWANYEFDTGVQTNVMH